MYGGDELMTIAHTSKSKVARIDLRLSDLQRELITRGAAAKNKSVSEFILDAVCLEAEMAILDQRVFTMNAQDFEVLLDKLDEPPQHNEGLEKLFSKRAPWLQK
jgi:uncharacterized protein (DUF1778 family)